jgi:hypothetical protein
LTLLIVLLRAFQATRVDTQYLKYSNHVEKIGLKYFYTTSKKQIFSAFERFGFEYWNRRIDFHTLYWNDEHSYDKWNLKG